MKAIVKSMELKKIVNRYYLKVTMESQNKEYVLANPLLSDPINFRKQVFGMLSACNCYDLMRLAREVPVPQEAIGYYFEGKGYKIFENKEGQWMSFNAKTGTYSCQKADEDTKQLIKMAEERKISNVEVSKGTIERIRSESGVFTMLFEREEGGSSFFTTGQIYFGFGSPINIGNKATQSEKMESAKMFTSFIVSLMKFCNKEDLLKLGGEIERYPEVDITLDHSNKINSIRNATTGLGFSIGKNYEIIDSSKTQENERLD